MERYRTSDFYYAAYLKTAAVEFIGTETEGSRVYFVFEKPEGIRELKRDFFNRKAKVSAMTYADEIRALKNLTHLE